MNSELIRKATVNDVKCFAALYANSWSNAYKGIIENKFIDEEVNLKKREKFFSSLINNRNFQVFAIENNNIIVGLFVIKTIDNNDISVLNIELVALYIHRFYWRSGFGTNAINFIKKMFKKNIIENSIKRNVAVTLWVLEENYIARNFYEKNGFEITGNIKNVKFGEQIKKALQYKLLY